MAAILTIYALIVIGGWLGLRPGKCNSRNVWYQLWANLFIEADRSLCDLIPKMHKGRETLSSWAARENRTWEIVFNALMLDPNHCRRYAGV